MNIFDKVPSVDKSAFVAPSASMIGDVQVGQGSSIWYGCVLRGKFLSFKSSRLFVVFQHYFRINFLIFMMPSHLPDIFSNYDLVV